MITTWGSSWCHLTSVGGYCHRAAIFRCSPKCASHKWHLIDISDASSDCHRAVIAMPFQGCTICFVTFLRVQQFKIKSVDSVRVISLYPYTLYVAHYIYEPYMRLKYFLCPFGAYYLRYAFHNLPHFSKEQDIMLRKPLFIPLRRFYTVLFIPLF